MIYLIQAVETPYVKIGFTDGDPRERLSGLQCGCPYKLKLVATIPGDLDLEEILRNDFDDERVRGEWFVDTPEIREAFSERSGYICKGCGRPTRRLISLRGTRRYCPGGCPAYRLR